MWLMSWVGSGYGEARLERSRRHRPLHLHLMGFGAKALSGASVSDPAVRTAFCGPGERLANWVIAGRPVRAAHPKAGAEASAVISGWRMDQG